MIKKINEGNFGDIAATSGTSVLMFTSAGCWMCTDLKPIAEKLSVEYGNFLNFYSIGTDDPLNEDLMEQIEAEHEVDGVPTIYMIHENVWVEIPWTPEVGYSESYLRAMFESVVGRLKGVIN